MREQETRTLKILPLGGLREIGMNMMALAWGQDAIIIDAGLMFPDQTMPGVDLVIPDLDALIRREWNILGLVLTHGHEDHIGALPYLLERLPVPVYATNFTMGLAEHKLEEFGLLDKTSRYVVSSGAPVVLGPFQIDLFAMCHSVPDGVGLAVSTPAGLVIHSGDFKIDPYPVDGRRCDLQKLSRWAAEGVLLLFSDSTNVENEGEAGSETTIGPVFQDIFSRAQGRVIIATFSSNIHRIQQVFRGAKDFHRKVVLVGRSMATNVQIAEERGYLDIPPGVLADIKDMDSLPDNRVAILSTGSQGEPMSALSLMAYGRHKYLSAKPDDVLVLSCRFIPGNEKAINHIINEFSRRGARVEYEKVRHVHVSGHAYREELRSLIRLVRPRYFIPVHGEYRHLLRHAHLAMEEQMPPERVLIAEDGDVINISWDKAEIVEKLELKRVLVDGKGVGDVEDEVLRDRRTLSEVGVITVVIVVETDTGRLLSGPAVFSRGVTYQELEPDLIAGARRSARERLAELDPRTPEQWEKSKDEIRLAVRRYVNRELRRKPIVQTMILHI